MNELLNILLLTCGITTLIAVMVWLLARYFYQKSSINEALIDKIILQISVPTNNDKSPLAAEQFFQALHGILKNDTKAKDHFSFELVAVPKGIYFIIVCARRYKQFVENQVYAQYPQAQIKVIKDYTQFKSQSSKFFASTELELKTSYFLPFRTFNSFEVDPLASITGAISKLQSGHQAWIQTVVRPIDSSWQSQGKSYVDSRKGKVDSEGKKVQLESGESDFLREIETKNAKVGFQFLIRVITQGPDEITTQHLLEDIVASYKQFQTAQLNSIVIAKPKKGILNSLKTALLGLRKDEKMPVGSRYSTRILSEKSRNIINIEELASLFHLPSKSVETPNIAWAKSKKLEIPKDLPLNDGRMFALTDFRNSHLPFGIKQEDRRRHMYVLGKTGSGKTTLMKTMIVADIREGKGVAVIDPHGDLIEELLDLIPEYRKEDVVWLDPSDTEHPVGLNMLDLKENETMELLADGIVSVFKKFFGNSWGPRLQYILANVILTLLHTQNVSLLAVQRILIDKNYRKFLLKQVKDPFILQFWEKEYEEMSKNARLLTEAIAPIQNKVGRFLNSSMVRNMIGQVKSTIDLPEIMNNGKILLVNLSQGKIGEENSSLLGGMIVTRLYTNAMQRAFLSAEERNDFYVYVDEFQNFATETFIKILSEARKYGLNLIVTHQYIDQLTEDIQKAIFGNVGTMMNYVVGQHDATRLAGEYAPYLEAEDLVNLEKYRLAMKMMIDGAQSQPFTAIAMPPNFKKEGFKEQIKNISRKNFANPREEIELKLNKWSNQNYNEKGNLMQPEQGKKEQSKSKKKLVNDKRENVEQASNKKFVQQNQKKDMSANKTADLNKNEINRKQLSPISTPVNINSNKHPADTDDIRSSGISNSFEQEMGLPGYAPEVNNPNGQT